MEHLPVDERGATRITCRVDSHANDVMWDAEIYAKKRSARQQGVPISGSALEEIVEEFAIDTKFGPKRGPLAQKMQNDYCARSLGQFALGRHQLTRAAYS
jgi:hypothetical protein